MIDRRGFLSSFAGAAAATGALGIASPGSRLLEQAPSQLPDHALYDSDEEKYWAELRKQFLIPADEVYLNNGTVGSSPAPVLRAVFDGYNDTERMAQSDPEDYPICGYGPWNEFRDPLAAFVGCSRDEIALLRNATEANSYIANGIDLKAGDEVLITDQEHPGGEHPWDVRAKRYGVVLKKVALPKPVARASEVLNKFNDAIHAAYPDDFFQSHHDGDRRRLTCEGALRACAIKRNFVSCGRRARPGHDEVERA